MSARVRESTGNFKHAIQGHSGVGSDVGRNRDLIDDSSLEKVFQRPKQVRRVDTKHRRTEAAAIVQRNDEAVRVLFLQSIDEMDFRTDRKLAAGRRLADAFDDVFGRTDIIAKLRNFEPALGMTDDSNPWILCAYLLRVLRQEPLVYGAVTFTENEPGFLQLFFSVSAELFVRIPNHHLFETVSERVSGVATQMLIRKEQDFVAAFQRPSHDGRRIRRSAD